MILHLLLGRQHLLVSFWEDLLCVSPFFAFFRECLPKFEACFQRRVHKFHFLKWNCVLYRLCGIAVFILEWFSKLAVCKAGFRLINYGAQDSLAQFVLDARVSELGIESPHHIVVGHYNLAHVHKSLFHPLQPAHAQSCNRNMLRTWCAIIHFPLLCWLRGLRVTEIVLFRC